MLLLTEIQYIQLVKKLPNKHYQRIEPYIQLLNSKKENSSFALSENEFLCLMIILEGNRQIETKHTAALEMLMRKNIIRKKTICEKVNVINSSFLSKLFSKNDTLIFNDKMEKAPKQTRLQIKRMGELYQSTVITLQPTLFSMHYNPLLPSSPPELHIKCLR